MLKSRKKVIIAAVVAATAAFVLVTQIGAFSPSQGALKLEGAWVARVIAYPYGPPPYPYQWSYVLAPDTSSRSAAIHGSVDVGFQSAANPPLVHTPIIGEIVQTGPDTAAFNTHWCEIRPGPINEIVYFLRSWGEVKFVEPGKAEATHNFEIYPASADTNGDGLPEGKPSITFTVTSADTRIPPPGR